MAKEEKPISKFLEDISTKLHGVAAEKETDEVDKNDLMRRKERRKKLVNTQMYKELEKKYKKKKRMDEFIKTDIAGLDSLFEKGVPKGTSVLVVGGPGSGKTIFCLQILYNAAKKGEKCLYLSFEENEERLKQHMRDFGWDPEELEKKGLLIIKRIDIFEISRSIEAMLAKAKGELLIDVKGISSFIPKDFEPDRVVIDSLTALSAAFTHGADSYRSYIEQSFLFLEELGCTSFLISESEDAPHKLSPSGVEEFLADGVIILYNIRKGDVKERALEVLKMRGAKFQEKIVATRITEKGIVVYPQQQVFGGIGLEVH